MTRKFDEAVAARVLKDKSIRAAQAKLRNRRRGWAKKD